jgi:hypothetical protein
MGRQTVLLCEREILNGWMGRRRGLIKRSRRRPNHHGSAEWIGADPSDLSEPSRPAVVIGRSDAPEIPPSEPADHRTASPQALVAPRCHACRPVPGNSDVRAPDTVARTPYPEPGLRLIRQDRIEEFDERMREFREELSEAVEKLDQHYEELRQAARQRLGTLFNPGDYPPRLSGLFDVAWEFPPVEPPDYLRQLNPALYRQECERMQERFHEAVRLAEEAFTSELARLISHLTERLSGAEDGKPKIFRDSAVTNLTEFFERFRQLNIGSSEQLEELVTDARRVVRGIAPQELRDSSALRQHVATEMSRVQSILDGLLVDRPRRNILRRPK